MLILLILIIKVYSTIVAKAQQVGKTKKEKVTDVASATPAPAAKAASPAPVAQTAQGQIDDEVVAVISAAVATMYASPEKVRIKSIKKSNGGRNAWANAGLLNNTRPF
jgi:3-oxoacyl-ACP reductase-like protein